MNRPARGRVVDVFGYPGTPPRPHGAWVEAIVRGQVENRHLQLDSTLGSALRIQPGFSGSPVYDRGTGRIVGLLNATPPAASRERDSYAITVDRLRLAWPEVLDPRHAQAGRRAGDGISELTVLHVSDPQFGRHHLVGGNGLTPADQAHDTLFQRLHEDLHQLAENHGLRPDLMVVTGDLAEWRLPSEFEQVVEFLTALTEAAQLSRRQVAIVPGNHDVNRKACAASFQEQEADEHELVAPYWPKWKHFAAAFSQVYADLCGSRGGERHRGRAADAVRNAQSRGGGGRVELDGEVTDEQLQSFVRRVRHQFASVDTSVRSELVYRGHPVTDKSVTGARRHALLLPEGSSKLEDDSGHSL